MVISGHIYLSNRQALGSTLLNTMGFTDIEHEYREQEENPLHSLEFKQMLDHYLYQGSILAEMIESVEGEFNQFRFCGNKIRITIERNDDEE